MEGPADDAGARGRGAEAPAAKQASTPSAAFGTQQLSLLPKAASKVAMSLTRDRKTQTGEAVQGGGGSSAQG